MVRRSNRLPFYILAVAAVMLIVGCSQTEDVVTPITTTEIELSAERLPTPPSGMAYELWVSSTDDDTISLGKFSFDGPTRRFLNLDGTTRSNLFVFDEDLLKVSSGDLKFRQLFISVELEPDDSPGPGPVMLVDDIADPNENPFELRFPLSDSLWKAYVRYNLESASDLDRTANDGNGIWFSRYQTRAYDIPDTIGVTKAFEAFTNADTLPYRYLCEMENVVVDTTAVNLLPGELYMGAGTLDHVGMFWDFVYCWDSVPPIEGEKMTPTFQTRQRGDTIDWFSQDGFGLPNYADYGWHWKGWVVLPSYNTVAMTTRWRLTPPVWRYKTTGMNYIPGDDGVLFTTGEFYDITAEDLSNPYKADGPIPPFPGEDFLNSAALQAAFGIDAVQLLPLADGNAGTVFITLEPDNFPHDTTNFPLFAFIQPLPSGPHGAFGSNVGINMYNRTATVNGDLYGPGFPQVNVVIKRH